MNKKRNLALYIDGENVPAKLGNDIIKIVRKMGVLDYGKVYGLQKDNSTRKWTEFATKTPHMKDIRLYGNPAKNKVDNKIKKDILKETKEKRNIDIVVLVSSDCGYVECIRQLRNDGKRVNIIGEKKACESLKEAGNEFVVL